MVRRFEFWMVERFTDRATRSSPSPEGATEGLAPAIAEALTGALQYGWTQRTTLFGHVELALTSGLAFLDDPMHPWTPSRPSMTDSAAGGERAQWRRMRQAWIDAGAEPDTSEWQLLSTLIDQLLQGLQPTSAALPEEADLVVLMQLQVGCRRVAAWTVPAKTRSLATAHRLAEQFGQATALSRAAMLLVMFAWGHAFADDPRHAWVAGLLGSPAADRGGLQSLRRLLLEARRRIGALHAMSTERLPAVRTLADGRSWRVIGLPHDR